MCVREVQKSLKESVKRLVEDKIQALRVGSQFRILNDAIVTPGDGVVLFQGMQDHTAESIKSLEGFDIGYVEEAQTMTARSLEMLRPTIRKDPKDGVPGSELWFSWNPRKASDPIDEFLRGQTPPPNAIVVEANYSDNPFFPNVLDEERAFDEITKRGRYGHIWLGHYEPAAIGAIWDRVTIHNGRRSLEQMAGIALQRIVVAVDPAVSSNPDSDEHGIVVCGLGEDGHGYVLDDQSTRGGPRHWADRALAAYDLHEADAIVCEINNGGELVKSNIEAVRKGPRIIEVRATRGKHVRAEPISALYSLGKIHHVGTYPHLEDQMCLMTAAGYEGEGSPDHVDAMVWGMTELFPKMIRKVPSGGAKPGNANNRYNPHHARG